MATSLTINFELANESAYESYPVRSVTLQHPHTNFIKIGRGSKSGDAELYPDPENALFDSRVMSREHALITADFANKQLFVEDVGSMHGTKINNRSIIAHSPERLQHHDVLRFGAEVSRGADHFPPLDLTVSFNWSDTLLVAISKDTSSRARNTFIVPEFSDDEFEEDEEDLQIFREIVAKDPSQPNTVNAAAKETFSIPDSDDSDLDSVASSYPSEYDDHNEVNTSPSSPAGLTDAEKKADLATVAAVKPLETSGYEDAQNTHMSRSKTAIWASEYITESEADEDDFGYYEETRQASGAAGHERQDHRAPSPSDAAMPKPSAPTATPCDGHNHQNHHSAGTTLSTFADSDNSFRQRLPGVSSFRLTESDSSVFPSYECPPILPADRTTYVPPYSGYFAPATYPSPDNGPLWSSFRTGANLTSRATEAPTTHADGTSNQATQGGKPAKRKADLISAEDAGVTKETSGPDLQEITAYTFYHPAEGSSNLTSTETASPEPIKTTENPEVEAPTPMFVFQGERAKAEPPRRRVRLTQAKSKRGGSFGRYAATAVAGMAIGAIGAVWGLVSLPEDFFA